MTTPRTWPEATRPTADQLLAWLRVPDNDDAITTLAGLLEAAEDAHRCRVSGHDSLLRELDQRTAALRDAYHQGNRYRLAWLSARERAAAADESAPKLPSIELFSPGGKLDRLREQGRRLASQRDDLIATGADPAELAIPLYPATPETTRP